LSSASTHPARYPRATAERLQYELTAYDAWYRDGRLRRPFFYHQRTERAFVRSLAARYRIAPGSRLIDIGCGNGFYAHAFAAAGLRVTAVDLSDAAIAHARAEYGDSVEWIAGDAFSLPPAGTFDYAFCHFFTFFNAAEVPGDFAEYGRSLMRYLRPGGTLFFVWHTDLTAVRLPPDRFSIMNFTIKQLEALFPDYPVTSHAVDSLARLPGYLGRFAYNKYVTRLCCAAVHILASDWRRARVIVAVRNQPTALPARR
jgi:SAM-dependent methyltransferase